jgi:predicted NAD/FAD-binding protein
MRKLGIVAIVGGSNAGLLEDSWCWRRSVIELLEAEKRLGGFE